MLERIENFTEIKLGKCEGPTSLAFASWMGGIIAASVIGSHEYMLESIVALAAFIPIIIGMGGNIGTQSSTIIVRGMATGRIEVGSEFNVLFKEIKVGILLVYFTEYCLVSSPNLNLQKQTQCLEL